jgi:hypothetical protein
MITVSTEITELDHRMMNECGAVGGMRIGWGESKYSEKTRPNATLSTTNPT